MLLIVNFPCNSSAFWLFLRTKLSHLNPLSQKNNYRMLRMPTLLTCKGTLSCSLFLSIVPRNRAFRVSKSICQKAALKGMSLIVPPMTAPLPKAPHLHPSLLEVTRYRALNPPKQLFLLVQNTFICIRGRKLLLSLEGRCAGKQGRLAYCFTKRRLSITRWPVLLIQTASLAAVWRTVNLHLSV